MQKSRVDRERSTGSGILSEVSAGLMMAAIQVAQAASYIALILPGETRSEFGIGYWAALLGIGVVGIVTGIGTSMRPIGCGPDTPTLAVSSAVSATIAAEALRRGYGAEAAALHVLIALSIATATGGLVMLLLGIFRLGQALRFIPFAVVGGFLGATGLLVIFGGVKLVAGPVTPSATFFHGIASETWIQLAVAVSMLAVLLLLRRLLKSPLLIPGVVLLYSAGVAAASRSSTLGAGWYLGRSGGVPRPWSPIDVANSGRVSWSLMWEMGPEIATIVIVTLISLIVKIATVESSRSIQADYDAELKSHGLGNLIVAPLGGLSMSLLLSATKVAMDSGSRSWASALVSALAVAALMLLGVDMMQLIPAPVLAGLLLFVGWGLLTDGLAAAVRQRAWLELGVSLAIVAVCVVQGYIVGVLAGLVVSCLIFAIDYGRVGIIRRHLTRAELSGAVTRAPEISTFLKSRGTAIHIYWLNGYMFFGSSEQLFADVRRVIEAPADNPVRFVVLDFATVSGADASAQASLLKLKTFCAKHGAGVVISSLSPDLRAVFIRLGLAGPGEPDHADFQRAVEWCEQQILDDEEPRTETEAEHRLQQWLMLHIGRDASVALWPYLERQTLTAGEVLHEAGAGADSIDFVARGILDLSVQKPDGERLVVRRMARETIVGEMGFFRSGRRSTRVSAHSAAVIFRLTRAALGRLETEQTGTAIQLHKLIIRELSMRLELANSEAAALR